jgi:hypothetical protein
MAHPNQNRNSAWVPHLRDGFIVAKVGEAAIPLREAR